ncbi:MAG: fibro-slime domain-containing protein, partial [Actinomycetota bacterium]
YAGTPTTPSTHGSTYYNMWYHDTPGYNITAPPYSLTLSMVPGSSPARYRYENYAFFPIDGLYYGNEGKSHNYWFTFESHSTFTYQGGEVFNFAGDDDVWVFINHKLVVDLGGVHPLEDASVALDSVASSLGMATGGTYPFDLFFAERHTVGSDFVMETSIALTPTTPPSNATPSVSIDSTAPAGAEGSAIPLNATVTDDGTPALAWTYTLGSGWDPGAACSFANPAAEDTSISCTDDGVVTATLTAGDGVNPPVSASVNVSVGNAAPVASGLTLTGATGPACVGGNTVGASFSASDAGTNDTLTGTIAWGDSTSSSGFSATHLFPAGTYTLSATASDDDGGSSLATAGTTSSVSFLYASSGILQPINADGSSRFKRGSTIPVKIRVTDCNGTGVGSIAPHIALTQLGSGSGDVNEVASSSSADSGTTMRYATDGQYIFNLSTKLSQFNAGQDLTAGRYRLRITAPQIAPIVVDFDIVR